MSRLLDRLLFRDVVFAMDWEDPATQHRALELAPGDVAVAITAGGCNVLDLALARPAKLYCVDGNPAQSHLLELKLAAIRALDHATFFDIFAARAPSRAREVYAPLLRPLLSPAARAFWDQHLRVVAGGLYRAGRIGLYLRLLRGLLRAFGITPRSIAQLLDAPDLAAQRRWFDAHLRGRLEHPIARRFLRSRLLNVLSGMHPAQVAKIEAEGTFDVRTIERLEHVLTALPVRDNYFVAMAATGRFHDAHVPRYLRREHFEAVREAVSRIEVVTSYLDAFLARLPARSVDKLYLLDIFDWMTPAQIETTMAEVARVAAPGAICLYRAVPTDLAPPASVLRDFTWDRALSDELLRGERSTIHGSLHVLRHCDCQPALSPDDSASTVRADHRSGPA